MQRKNYRKKEKYNESKGKFLSSMQDICRVREGLIQKKKSVKMTHFCPDPPPQV